jgi:hypothetical protein
MDLHPEYGLNRVVNGIIPDRIFYPHPHFLPSFCLNLRKKGMENPRKSHPFYNPGLEAQFKSCLISFESGFSTADGLGIHIDYD